MFAVKGIEPRQRRFYKLWEERKPSDAVIEVTSRKTKKNGTLVKPAIYRQVRVHEYLLFDPTQDYLDPWFQG